jgi:arsenical pump membrane protein
LIQVGLLLAASLAMILRPRGIPTSAGPVVGVVVALATTLVDPADAWRAFEAMRSPLLFLVFAVPLAVALDRLGVFDALAATFDGGRHLVALLWWFAAFVVIVFNLDAAVVLLTPLYIRIAQRQALPAEALAFQPALVACFASGVLPVSNLTNLIVADQLDLGVSDFLAHGALPSLVATAIGYLGYRSAFPDRQGGARIDDPVDRRALVLGLPIIAFVLMGFTVGDLVGVPAWSVAAVAAVWAAALARTVPWRAVPVEAIAIAASLAVLVAAAAPHLGLDGVMGRSGAPGSIAVAGAATLASNLTNNLPVTLAGTTALSDVDRAWPLLIGTNVGGVFLMTASLSTLLWRDTARRSGVDVTAARWTTVAVRAGAPALAGAVVTLLVAS